MVKMNNRYSDDIPILKIIIVRKIQNDMKVFIIQWYVKNKIYEKYDKKILKI